MTPTNEAISGPLQRLGIVGTSRMEDEGRVPIHPDHLPHVAPELRTRLVFERGYGQRFGLGDDELAAMAGGVASRHELLAEVGAVVLPKPVPEDLRELREGGLLWGWPHCVQQRAMTQVAIDRRLTLIAFEDMFEWSPDGHVGRHTFYKNNQLAGYSAVLHALALKGLDGLYGRQRKVVIIGFGAVSRGAIHALQGRGFRDVTVCVVRPDFAAAEEVPGCEYRRVRRDRAQGEAGPGRALVTRPDGSERPLVELLSQADIIVNAIFQDPNDPLMFVLPGEEDALRRDALIIDVSCDEGMAFPFAKPTSFRAPMFPAGPGGRASYYAVDHTPSYLWQAASRTISEALLKHLPTVLGGPDAWPRDEVVQRAIPMARGVIRDARILAFQGRESDYPHPVSGQPA